MNKHIVIFSSLILLFLGGCGLLDGPTICTLEFVYVSVEVTGDTLDQTYTIQTTTGDTVQQSTEYVFDQRYLVLDDGYQPEMRNREREFRFVGLKNGDIVIDELYVIKADECHIEKVSGIDTIEL
ncbi:MAG: hypothetical protein AAFP83_06535 [Bacteroidota bacterium]